MSSHSTILDSDSAYAKHRQLALTLIYELRAIGAQADLDLPRIVVIGNQGAGKSSLVEAISGINVPRDADTCTRCPIECRLAQSSGSWRCKVSIRWEFDTNGIRNDGIHEVQFGPELTDPKDVEFALRRAQAAVLHPKIPVESYENMTAEELEQSKLTNELKFSRNAICVELSGPQLTDLAFVDLPGIVQNADDEIVKLLKHLVRAYIQGDCLILVALPMSNDIENQKAIDLAREVDPDGSRTIGVLTKPDLVTTAPQKSRCLDIIEGREHARYTFVSNIKCGKGKKGKTRPTKEERNYTLKHGYYCTRQPDEDERGHGITSAEARVAETDFFLKTLPWATSAHQSRFGTQNLVMTLSKLLSKGIDKRLSTLSTNTRRQLIDCDDRLAALPAPITSERSFFVLGLVTSFCNDARSHIQGQTVVADLVQDNRRTYKTFRSDIRSTAPSFLPFADSSAKTLELNSDIQDLLKIDDEEEDGNIQPTAYIYLKDVRECIAKMVTRELPNNVPYLAKASLIQDFQKHWKNHVRKCSTAVQRTLQDYVMRLVKSKFGSYVHLESRISRIVNELVQNTHKEACTQLDKILKYETSPFTQNELDLSVSKEAFLTKCKVMRTRLKKTSAPLSHSSAQTVVRPGTDISATSTGFSKPPESPDPVSSKSDTLSVPPWCNFWKPFDESSGYRSDCPCTGTYVRHVEDEGVNKVELRLADYSMGHKSLAASDQSTKGSDVSAQSVALVSTAPTTAAAPGVSLPAAGFSSLACHTSSIIGSNGQAYDRKQDEANILAGLARLGITGLSMEDVLGRLDPVDEYEEEIQVMAEVRAYFKVSYQRITDYVPLVLDHDFLFAFADALQDCLFEKLALGTKDAADKCVAYLAEDHIAAAREELLSRKERLKKVHHKLLTFGS